MKSRIFSLPLSCVFSRFSAVVTIPVPEAMIASFITWLEGNFPVPTNSLERKVLSAIFNMSSMFVSSFDVVTFVDFHGAYRRIR
jgi:hypothetical protein